MMYVSAVRINGISTKLNYKNTNITFLPKIISGKLIQAERPMLVSLQRESLSAVEFSYTAEGYLAGLRQGEVSDEFKVETETLAERQRNLQSQDHKSGVKHTGKVAGVCSRTHF